MTVEPIFDIEFPLVKSQQELDALFKARPDLDESYIHTSSSFWTRKRKKRIEEMWLEYEPYADPGFKYRIRQKGEFLSRCWEMVLACAFLRIGYSLAAKKSDEGPDIKITSSGQPIWIEAVVATPGSGPDAIPPMKYGVVQTLPMSEMALRFGNSVVSKFRKYQKYLEQKIVSSDEPFVIAISRGPISRPDAYPSSALRYLYGIGDLTLRFPLNPNTGERGKTEEFLSRQPPIAKLSGKTVPVAFFEDPGHAGISGVIDCDNHVLNHPDLLGGDFILLRNPNALNKLPDDFISIGAEWVAKDGRLMFLDKKFIKQGDAFDYLEPD